LVVGGKAAGYRATLCRCGASKNKPWCDRSHVAAGFKASGEPATDRGTLATREARRAAFDHADEKRTARSEREPRDLHAVPGAPCCARSRPGCAAAAASSNKPFCDGTHKKIGFIG